MSAAGAHPELSAADLAVRPPPLAARPGLRFLLDATPVDADDLRDDFLEGAGVFLVDRRESPNLTQIIEAISRDGYVVAREHLPEAVHGDVRMVVMNSQPLVHQGE